jgi:hypothetical protein
VNWQHLQAILWLRWRMSLNQMRRGGIASTVILALLGAIALTASISMFFVALLVGIFALPKASPAVTMYVWDAVVLAFLMFWMVGLLTELQRSEVLSLEKLLHLPVSLSGTFLINYLGSLLSLTLVIFVPGMIGLSIALVVAKGPALLFVFPLAASFLLMVTAITYQFQGWLAALMANKRRRRTVIVVVTMCFVLTFQLPNFLNFAFHNRLKRDDGQAAQLRGELDQLARSLAAGEIDTDEYARQQEALQAAHQAQADELSRQRMQRAEQIAARVNVFMPIGWLPYGVRSCAAGNVLPAILGTLGASLIGAASLWRSYRTILRLYTGQFTSGRAVREPAAAPTVKAAPADMSFLERQLPGLSAHASAIALTNFRSLTRAPEAKMLLLAPVIMIILFGSMLLTRRVSPPELLRPLLGFGVIATIQLTIMQLIGNQFGLDRDGFRMLVLSSAPRRDVLLGKNVSVAPLVLTLGTIALALLQALYPMRVTHFLATLAELGSLFLICSLIGNFTSILAPMPVAAGSLKPVHPKWIPVMIQLMFFFLFPIVFGIAMLPFGLEVLLHQLGWLAGVPIYFLSSAVQLAIVCWLYCLVVRWQGKLLQRREQKILSIVTSKLE